MEGGRYRLHQRRHHSGNNLVAAGTRPNPLVALFSLISTKLLFWSNEAHRNGFVGYAAPTKFV